MDALLSMVKPTLLGLTIVIIYTVGTYVVNVIKNKKNNIERFTKKQRKAFKNSLVACLLCILLLLMQFQVFVDMYEQQTENIIGTITAITSSRKAPYAKITIETVDGEFRMVCGASRFFNKYDFDIGEIYQFEYFVNSKTINNAVPIDN